MGERLFITFALTGRSSGFYVTQGVALGYELVGLSARAWPLTIGLWTRWAFSPCLAADNRALDSLGYSSRLAADNRALDLLGYSSRLAVCIAASALKGQPVHSPGQRPGYQCINAHAL